MAVKAARSMVDGLKGDEHLGIFAVDLGVTVLSPFTRSTRELHAALDVLLRRPPVIVASSSTGGVAETEGPPGTYLSREDAQAAEIRKRLDAGFEGPQHAAAQAASLTDLIARLGRFPGRRALILFSEGLSVSPRLETAVDRARAENVTIYTINARGLDARAPVSPRMQEVDAGDLTGTSRVVRPTWSRQFPELDQTSGLGPLAGHTGGFFAGDSNDLVAAVTAVNADRRAFYVLAYVSSNEALDNTIRQIEVRVKRPGVSVGARQGYIAAEPDTRDLPDYELPVLQALARVPYPRDFEFAVRAYRTPKPSQVDLVSVLVEIPGSTLEFRREPTLRKYRGEVAVLTRIRSGDKTVAQQSQLYILTGDLSRLDEFSTRPLSYFRTASLPPGAYKVETAVYDRTSNRVSVVESTIDVPHSNDAPVIAGDLMLVRDLGKVKTNSEEKSHPLAWRRIVINPVLDDEVRSNHRRLTLAIPLVIERGPVTARLSLVNETHQLAEVPVSLGKPEKDGRLIPIIDFPITNLPAGNYTLTLKLAAPGFDAQRSATVVLK
jgi:VWFA-related protein